MMIGAGGLRVQWVLERAVRPPDNLAAIFYGRDFRVPA
jgi:hypothetical protein